MSTTELPPLWSRILDALTQGPRAWATPENLAAQLEIGPDLLTDELASMDVAGWLDIWERPEEIAVTLSTWAAERLGLRLTECGGGLSYRWIELSHPEPAAFRAKGVAASAALEDLDLVIDPSPPPEAAVDALDFEDHAPGSIPVDPASLPRPTRLLGESLTPWPGPDLSRPGTAACPGCRGARLGSREYCLRCDRWGLDGLVRAAGSRSSTHAPASAPNPNRPRPGVPTEGDRLREGRMARRRARFGPRSASQRHQSRKQGPG